MRLCVSTTESVCVNNTCSVLQSQTQSNISAAKDVLLKVGKPSSSEAKSLLKLFPSFSRFDPRSEAASTSSHKKKHKFVPKYSSVEVVMLKNFQTCIPKGECRQELLEAGHIKKVQLSRYMTPDEVKSKILEEFDCSDFSLLECSKGRLSKAKDNVVLTAQHAIARRGALYLCQKQKVSGFLLYNTHSRAYTSDIQYA